MNYQRAYIFSKYTDMLDYFEANQASVCGVPLFEDHEAYQKRVDNIRKRYAKARLVNLILLVRYEKNPLTDSMRTICKIKCPINPLPVVGDFETPHLTQVIKSLNKHGWEQVACQSAFDMRLFE